MITGNQMPEKLRSWLSPPDPSVNHNTACKTQHGGTATWFIQGNAFQDWKNNGSLLWVRGNRTLLSPFLPLCLLIDSWILQRVPEKASCGAWFLARLYGRIHILDKFCYYRGHQEDARGQTSTYGILLL